MRTCLQEPGVRVDGGDGAHALGHDGVGDGVPAVGLAQGVAQHRIHVVRGRRVARAQVGQDLEQLYLLLFPMAMVILGTRLQTSSIDGVLVRWRSDAILLGPCSQKDNNATASSRAFRQCIHVSTT